MNKLILLLLTAFSVSTRAGAQSRQQGAPYFQQQVNYSIDVTLHDADHTLDGFIQMQYSNHSPDTLTFIWIHCWPNAYKNDRTAFSEQLLGNGRTDFYFSDKEQKGYINHLEFRVDGQLARMEDHPQYIDIIKVLLPAPLPPGGQVTLTTPFHVRLPYNFSRSGYAPDGPPDPTSDAYQVTQWYPKPAVYDSHGWHPIPYLDQGEFYSEFGNFDVRITVPKSFIIAATGELQHGPSGRQRLAAGEAADSPAGVSPGRQESGPAPQPVTAIIHPKPGTRTAHPAPNRPGTHPSTVHPKTSAHPGAHPPQNFDGASSLAPSRSQPSLRSLAPVPAEATKTLHYHQDSIHDFAWFADRHFHTQHDTLQLASGRIIDVYSFYTPGAIPAWRHSIQYIKEAVRFRSALIGEYPFNVVTAAETKMGYTGGMEYPTITGINIPGPRTNNPGSAKELDLTIEHEVGHNWFYGIIGTNERRYPWMDEGINTYYDNRYEALKYPPAAPKAVAPQPAALRPAPPPSWLQNRLPDDLNLVRINTLAAIKEDQPISTPSEDFTTENYDLIAYTKTGLWMKGLEDSLGTPLFDSCMREYFRDWAYKHPYPGDLKTVFTTTSHRDLDTLFGLLDKTGPLTATPTPRKIRPTFLFNLRNTDKIDYLNIGPAFGFNDYDHLMVGLLIHNFNLPPEHWQLLLAPLYATGSHQLNGVVHLAHTWFIPRHSAAPIAPNDFAPPPAPAFFKIEAGANASRFSTISGTDSNQHQLFGGFYKVVPFVRLYFPKPSPRSTQESWLEWKTWLIGEKELNNYVQSSTDSLYYPTAGKYSFRYLNQLSYNIRDTRVLYPYSVLLQVQQASAFYRVNFTGNYFFNYEKSGGLDIRVFGAKFGYLGGRDGSQDLTPYEPKLTAVRGNEDYTYDNYFIGRNEFNGIASQQVLMRDGDLKLRTDLFQGLQGRSDNWVASLNLSSTLPPQIVPAFIPLKVFLDIGTYAQAWQNLPPTSHFLYVGGLELSLFHDVFRIYAPLAYSSDFSSQLKTVSGQNGLFQKMSFSIDFQNINFRKLFGYTPF